MRSRSPLIEMQEYKAGRWVPHPEDDLVRYYILQGKEIERVPLLIAAEWWDQTTLAERQVARTQIGVSEVSTIFMFIDHAIPAFTGSATVPIRLGPPKVFETRVMSGPLEGATSRYSTWEQAEAGHAATCDQVRALIAEIRMPAEFLEEIEWRPGMSDQEAAEAMPLRAAAARKALGREPTRDEIIEWGTSGSFNYDTPNT